MAALPAPGGGARGAPGPAAAISDAGSEGAPGAAVGCFASADFLDFDW